MAFGIREVCHCHFVPYAGGKGREFVIDTAKMSSLESASTTVYAQGGSGNSRLVAWESEKTLTFTVEDALLTLASFRALTGDAGSGNHFTIKSTSFAGTYTITAYTLVRDEDGVDHLATIVIPKAKLQTQLNLSMSPTGDPSTFTFTFDALPASYEGDTNVLFDLHIEDEDYNRNLFDETPSLTEDGQRKTRILIDNQEVYNDISNPAVIISNLGTISINGKTVGTLEEDKLITDLTTKVEYGTEGNFSTEEGQVNKFYIV